jgi:N-methylhydantoinase B
MYPAQGANGGDPGAKGHSEIHRTDGTVEVIASKMLTTLNAGDRVVVNTAGGGGWGPTKHRDDARTERDRANGKLSAG